MTRNPPGTDGPDIRPQRLGADEIQRNFSDMHPPLKRSEALIEADRCYFCHDAPCTAACPTGIDIPSFIQKIRSDNIKGAARTILKENILGGMCARVCPTEVLCEGACVRLTHEEQPVRIGLLQRYATDPVLAHDVQLFDRGPDTGKRVAVIGGGPAGLSCAHRLAMLGHAVTIFNRDAKGGGLNEYGIAAYKTVDDFAQRELEYVLAIGGIELRNGVTVGVDVPLERLRDEYDAVFLGGGLTGVNRLGIENEGAAGVLNAVDYIAELRQAQALSRLPVGRRVAVIGGGMTAIDIAVQSKLLGAEQVDLFYRRGPEQMGASSYEQAFAQIKGVGIRHYAAPLRVLVDGDGRATGVLFARTVVSPDRDLQLTDDTFAVEADLVFKAVGQALALDFGGATFEQQGGKLTVDAEGRTSIPGIWAGGDCVQAGDDLTVTAVQHGKLAAVSIDRHLRS